MSLVGTLPAAPRTGLLLDAQTLKPGTPVGPSGQGGSPPLSIGSGWEVRVLSYADYHTLLCQVPPKVITSMTFTKQLNDIGSINVALNMDDPFWTTYKLGDGSTPNTILDFECLWQFVQDGVVRFEGLGETIAEQLTDTSEQRIVTITGPGTIATLKWAMAAPEGFPNIILKIDGLVDNFDEVDQNGNSTIDTNIWTAISPASDVYITPVANLYSYPGGSLYQLSTLYPSGTMTLEASTGTTYLGSSPWDATDTLISCQISPVGVAGMGTNTPPSPYGTGLDGSELTQMYIQSMKNQSYYALFGLTSTAFYVQLAGPNGTFTKTLPTYDNTKHAYWMITEQGGSGGGSGTFYFWTSPDGQVWTQQWSIVHNWDATEVVFYITAHYDVNGTQSAVLQNLNTNVTTASYQGNIYLGDPLFGVWYDLLKKAQSRGTIPFVQTGQLNGKQDSFQRPWTDINNVQTTNGTDLYSMLQSCASTVNADYVMQPGFLLQVGQPEQGIIAIGVDRTEQIVFYEGHDGVTKQRTRARNQIVNLVGAENSDGREISASNGTSISEWGQREGWYQAAAAIDPTSMELAAAAAVDDQSAEILTWTFTMRPDIQGKIPFKNFDVGDWVGLERPDFSAVDSVRIMAIAIQIDNTGVETVELTFISYQAWMEEQLLYLANKLGGQFINALGMTPVAHSKYGTGQLPTYFSTASSLGNLSNVTGASPGQTAHSSPLVYNASTGMWQPAGSPSTTNGAAMPVQVTGSGGTVTIDPSTGSVSASSATGTGAPDGGGSLTPPSGSTVTTPTGTTVYKNGGAVLQVGHQSDGTVTVKVLSTGTPNVPDTPTVAGTVLGVVVGWDGLLNAAQPLSDFSHVEVHLSTTSGFTPSSATYQGILQAGGILTVSNLTAATTYYAKLVAITQGNVASTPSAQASAVAQSVSTNIPNGSITAGQVSFTARNIGGITTSVQATQPSTALTGDLWYNTSNGNELYQYNGTAWTAYQYGTNAIAAGSVTAALIAANTITAAQIASGTITATQIQSATITATQIASSTITAGLLSAGIVVGGIINGTVVTGATLQNSSSDPRTSINPDGSLTVTNSSGQVLFELGPDGTMYWYNSAGILEMELQPGGTTLIYQSTTGATSYDFETSTNSFTGNHAALATSTVWASTGAQSLAITHSGTTSPWGAVSPAFTVVAGSTASMQVTVYTPTALSAVSIGFTFWSGSNGTGTNLGTASGDQGTVAFTAGETALLTITGATVPSGANSATFNVTETHADASSTVFYIDTVQIPGGLVYSNSPVAGTDSFGNDFDQGINFVGLPGLTNVFGVEDPYGNQLAVVDGQGNITGQTISAVNDVVVAGQSVSGLISSAPAGVVNMGWIPHQGTGNGYPNTPIAAGTPTGVLALTVSLQANRVYRVTVPSFRVLGGTVNEYVEAMIVYATGTSATVSSTSLTEHYVVFDNNAGFERTMPALTREFLSGSAQTVTFMLVLSPTSTTVQIKNANDATNGALAEMVVEDIGPYGGNAPYNGSNNGQLVAVTGSGGGGGGGTTTSVFYPGHTWSYEGNGVQYNYDSSMYQGQYSGSSIGSEYSYADFSAVSTTIPAGSTIHSATLRLSNLHSWYNSGMTCCTHASSALGHTDTALSSVVDTVNFAEGQTLTFNTSLAPLLIGGGGNTFLVLRAPSGSTNLQYYGYFYGYYSTPNSQVPCLTITWS